MCPHRYANVQSKLASLGALKHLANNGQGLAKEAGHTGEQREQEGGHEANQNQTQSKAWATKATLHQGLQELNPSDKKEERARYTSISVLILQLTTSYYICVSY